MLPPFAIRADTPRASRSRDHRAAKPRPQPRLSPPRRPVEELRPRTLTAVSGKQQQPQSTFADDPMTRLWKDAADRDTGHEAVEAIRARHRLAADGPSKRR
jgi:hypothetical protein